MKWSKYNFLFKSDRFGFLIYNSISNSFAELTQDLFNVLSKIEKNEIEVTSLDKDLLNSLVESKIVVKNEDDDLDQIYFNILKNRFDYTRMNLTIAPTQYCNFDCIYCYEKWRKPYSMTAETAEKIVSFVKQNKSVDKLHITWFGGEPLLEFQTIKHITEEIKKLNIKYIASIITNGFLLDKNIIEQFLDLNIFEIQITLDGYDYIHNKRRYLLNGGETYSTILKNIDNLCDYYKNNEITIKIRVNIDHSNANIYKEFYHFIKERYKSNKIIVYPGWVSDAENFGDLICFNNKDKSDFIFDLGGNALYPDNKVADCMARHVNSFLIGPEGNIYKCWHDLGNLEMTLGNIENLTENFDFNKYTRFIIGTDAFQNSKCRKCLYLPICWGGCPKDSYMNKYENKKINSCTEYKGSIQKYLEKYYEMKFYQEK